MRWCASTSTRRAVARPARRRSPGSMPRRRPPSSTFLRAVAVARITAPSGRAHRRRLVAVRPRARAGRARLRRERAAWARSRRKSGLPIYEDDEAQGEGAGDGRRWPPSSGRRSARSSRTQVGFRCSSMSKRSPRVHASPRRRWPVSESPKLLAIREKVRSGERLDGGGRHRALPRAAISSRSAQLANEVREKRPRRPHVLQPQHARRGHERLRRLVPLLLVRQARGAHAGRAHDEARGGLARARDAHGRPGGPPTEIHVVNGLHPGLPFSYYEELLRGFKRIDPTVHLKCFTARGDPLLRAALRHDRTTRCSSSSARRASTASRAAAPRSSTRTCASASAPDKATADEYLEVHRVAHRLGHAHERDDALRAHRDVRASRRSHAAPARAAGRDEGPPGLHPARVPPRRQRHEEPPGADRRGRPAHDRGEPPPARQRRSHQGVLGEPRRPTSRRSRFASAPTTSTAPSSTRRSTRPPGSTLAAAPSAYDELVRLIREAGRIPVERDTLYNVVREHARAEVPEAALKVARARRSRLPVLQGKQVPS